MKKLIIITFILFAFAGLAQAQNYTEGFETSDSLNLPEGWSKYNNASFPIDPATNWTVRDTGASLPGLSTSLSKAHTGKKAVGVSWWTSVDTTGGTSVISDAWLVTRRIHVWSGSAVVSYYAAIGGGAAPYLDSMQIWVNNTDSLPSSFLASTSNYVTTEAGSGPYGTFNQYFIDLSSYVGQTIWIGFRYNMDCTTDGYFIHIDDFDLVNPIGIQQISNEVPKKYELKQNYPNPFNPVTNIEFSIANTSNVSLVIYNSLGQEVSQLVNQELKTGTYKYDFNAANLPSGAYFYRLIAGDFVQTNKMILTK